jgi:hypothetical protein
MPKFNFDNLLKIAIPVFILLGFTQLTAYYNEFNFPIIQYIDYTEIITVFLGNFYTSALLLFPLFMAAIIKQFTESESEISSFMIFFIVIMFGLVISINFLYTYNVIHSFSQQKWIIEIESFIIIILLRYIENLSVNNRKFVKFKNSEKFNWFVVLVVIIVQLFYISLMGKWDADAVKKHHLFSGTTIILDSTEIKSNSNFYYIGKTNKYVIFFNQLDSSSTVYPMDHIQKVYFKYKNLNSSSGDGVRPYQKPPL